MKRTTKVLSAVALFATVFISNTSVSAQDRVRPTWWFGVAGAANLNFYRGTAQYVSADLTLPNALENGFGVAPYVAVFTEYRPSRVWGLMLYVAYDGRMGQFNRLENGAANTYSASLNAEFDYLAFEPSLRIAPFAGNFYVFIGPRLSYNVQNKLAYQDTYTTNNEAKWSDVHGVRLSAQVGIGYDIMLSAPANTTQFAISPFIAFIPYFGEQPRSVENLTLTTVRAGIAIKIGCGPKPVKVADAPPPIPAPIPEPDVQFAIQAPNSVPGQRIVKETLPLSNYVFFDAGSTAIPVRYVALTSDQAKGFEEVQLQDCQKNPGTRSSRQLTMYYNVLNIVGDRMKKHPASTITLAGSSAGKGIKIGKANAESVKNYLVNVFGIDGTRIKTVGRNQPLISSEKPNNTQDFALTSAEDSRVEIISASTDLMVEAKDNSALCLKPIEVTAMDGSSPDDAKINMNVTGAGNALTTWSVDVTDVSGNVQHFGPYTGDRETISGSAVLNGNKNGNYKAVMTGQTQTGHTITKESSFSLTREVEPAQQEHVASILFEFDKSITVATFTNFLTGTVAPLIPSNATVLISGYTDVVGQKDYNLNLSNERAKEAQSILESALAKTNITGVTFKTNGYGEVGSSFANTLPEERFYNRTVVIDIIPSGPVIKK
jgi:outer membrane protein OmpA-like peptidoglycan-associated protein